MTLELIGCLLTSYLLGGLPFGLLAVKVFLGKDVRKIGSGNIGATNVARCFPGRVRYQVFVFIYLLDMAKGFLPILFFVPVFSPPMNPLSVGAMLGLAAVFGHCFSPFLGFKGGKGVSTITGMLLALDWRAVLISFVIFGFVLFFSRVMAVASLTLGFCVALVVILGDPAAAFHERLPLCAVAVFLAFFLVWTHRQNIKGLMRLRRHRERGRQRERST